jgi:predicted DCC family thiol-disulfide oxidoreductase YuxK
MKKNGPSYSYRADPLVPSFPDDKPVLFYDGVCVLCSGFVHFILRADDHERIRLVAAQSPLGQAIYTHYDLEQGDYTTNLLLAEGTAHTKLNAFLKVMTVLGLPWSLTSIAYIIPKPIRNWFYDRIARNRYKVFGKHDTCLMVMKEHEHRFLS